jgi:hypothetical protein
MHIMLAEKKDRAGKAKALSINPLSMAFLKRS